MLATRFDHLDKRLQQTEQNMTKQLSSYREKLINLNTEILRQQHTRLMGTATDYLAHYKDNITKTFNDLMIHYLGTYKENLNGVLDEMVNDIYVAGENVQNSITSASHDIIKDINQQHPSLQLLEDIHKELPKLQKLHDAFVIHPASQPFPINPVSQPQSHDNIMHDPTAYPSHSSRWPNVKLDPTFRKSPNPFEFNMRPQPSDPTMQTNANYQPHVSSIPQSVDVNYGIHPTSTYNGYGQLDPAGLPWLNHDAAIKRAKVQFTGLGDMFVFYNQLLNALEQFGIFLTPLNRIVYKNNLCPATYNGIPIAEKRYQQMASTLYQKLQQPDVIPLEHTSIRNIINRFAEHNDGYMVLYSMLELVHPALQKDAVVLPPRSSDCDEDIHLYAQKFDSWLRYESYANRPYSPREQVNLFIRELSTTFSPAVSRVRRLMDAWQPFDTNVPELLRLSTLPNTIERFLTEETGSLPYIRQLKDKRRTATRTRDHESKDKDSRPVVDKICSFCGTHGHVKHNCDFMAKFLTATDATTKVDAKSKDRIQELYRQEQLQKRKKRLKKHAGLIRKLLDIGAPPTDIEAMLNQLPDILDKDAPDDESDSDSSEHPSEQAEE
jgi:hypothetical protein